MLAFLLFTLYSFVAIISSSFLLCLVNYAYGEKFSLLLFYVVLGGYEDECLYSIYIFNLNPISFSNTIVSTHLCLKHEKNLSFHLKCIF